MFSSRLAACSPAPIHTVPHCYVVKSGIPQESILGQALFLIYQWFTWSLRHRHSSNQHVPICGSVADPGIMFGSGTWRAREREPITQIWGRSHQRRQESGGSGGQSPPWSRKSFSFQTSSKSGRIASICLCLQSQ